MARIRAIHPRAPMDEDVASLPMDARVLWAYLPCYADKEGRLEDRPLFLKGQVFPGDSVDVGSMLDMFASRGFVIRYVDPIPASRPPRTRERTSCPGKLGTGEAIW